MAYAEGGSGGSPLNIFFYFQAYAQGKTDTETTFIVTVGFTTKVNLQTTLKLGTFSRQFRSFYRFRVEEKKEKSTTFGVRWIWRDAMCVCVERKEAGRQATEREMEKKKKKEKKDMKREK